MPKWKDEQTGEVYEGDERGNKIFPKTTLGRIVDAALPAGGSIIGGMAGSEIPIAGNIAGAALGSGLGTVGAQTLHRIFPETLGSHDIGGSGGEVVGNVATDLITGGIAKGAGALFPSVRANLAQRLGKFFFPSTLEPEIKAGLKQTPELGLSVGQSGQNPVAQFIEDTFAPNAKNALVKKQQDIIKGIAQPQIVSEQNIMKVAQQQATQNATAGKATSKQLYDAFEPAIPYNTKTVLKEIPGKPIMGANGKPLLSHTGQQIISNPTYEAIPIQGAIPLNKSKQFADTLGKTLDDIIGPSEVNAVAIGGGTGADLVKLRNELNKIRGVETFLDPVTKSPTTTMAEYEQLKAIKDQLSQTLKSVNKDSVLKTKLGGGLNALRNTLGDDIEAGVKGWGPNAYNRFTAAQSYWKQLSEKLDPKLAKQLINEGMNPQTTFKNLAAQAMNDPKKTQQLINIVGNRKVASDLFNSNLMKKAFNPTTGEFNPSAGLKYLADRDEVAKVAIPSNIRTNAQRFLKVAEMVKPFAEHSGAKLRLMTGGGLLLASTPALINGDIPQSAKYGSIVLGGALGGNLIGKILMNPTNARVAAGLLKAEPLSRVADIGTKSILGAIKGTQVYFKSQDGNTYPATIGGDGRIIVNSKNQENSDSQTPQKVQ